MSSFNIMFKRTIVLCTFPLLAQLQMDSLCEDAVYQIAKHCLCELSSSDEWDVPTYKIDCSFKNISAADIDGKIPDFTEKLDLSANNISEISKDSVFKGFYIQNLHLNKNYITEIAASRFVNMPNLAYLDLSENKLASLKPGVFRGLQKLKALNLASNLLTSFELCTFKELSSLKYLSFSSNPIGAFLANATNIFAENGIAIPPSLEALYLDDTGSAYVEASFLSDAYNLREISFSNNAIRQMPSIPYTVEYLDLSSTLISELTAKHFENLSAIKTLKLNNLPNLKKIAENTFETLKGLTKLELQNCRNLSLFSIAAFGSYPAREKNYEFPLNVITFRGSALSTLGPELEPLFDRLMDLDLQGNPWNCNCKIRWIRKLKIKSEYVEHVRCAQPRQLYNHQMFALKDNQLICETFNSRLKFFANTLLVVMCLVLTGFAIWLVFLWPKYKERRYTLQKAVSPTSPYSRITIEPNQAEVVH